MTGKREEQREQQREQRRLRMARAFIEAVDNQLAQSDWQRVVTTVKPIDSAKFSPIWRLLDAHQRERAEAAWSGFLASLAYGERDRIDDAFDVVCDALCIEPSRRDNWFEPSVNRPPLASDSEHKAERLAARTDQTDRTDRAPESEHELVDAALDSAPASTPDWQIVAQIVAQTVVQALATDRARARNPWPMMAGCFAVLLVMFCGIGLYEIERGRGETADLRARLDHARLDHVPVDMMTVDARPVATPGSQVRWIIDREHEDDWRVTVDIGDVRQWNGSGTVVPYSMKQYQTTIGDSKVTMSWGN